MRFVLCARDPMTAAASVVGDMSYATRAQATDALAAQGSLAGLEGREFFLVDLDAATPVVVVTAAGQESAPVESGDAASAEQPEARPPFDEWPFVSPSAAGGVGPSTLAGDRMEDETDLASVWWLEAGLVEEAAPSAGGPEGEGGQQEGAGADQASTPEDAPQPVEATEAESAAGEVVDTEPPEVADSAEPEFPAMTVDFETWTCSACIYVTTCPQSGTGRPATCGSFQWRPE